MIPEKFKQYIFHARREILEKMARGEAIDRRDIYLSFTRTLPAIISNGPAGLNASIKMVGLVPKEEFIEDILNRIREFISSGKRRSEEVLGFLLENIYDEDKIDFTKLGTLDLARKRTWTNLRNGGEAVLIFFTPPLTSFMIIADVEVHMKGAYFEYFNALHDLFHTFPRTGKVVGKHPTYIFKIREIWDKSADKFGERIYP